MRLTLRTLLAYLDDMLEPAETKLIGQKLQESAVAGKLVSLIRLVVRQRRLKAPSVSGPNIGIDPNIIAQYLDITLPPEKVVEVERVLLTSDELLAEVASCHQVLALSMGKTTEVSPASRESLYALGPVDQSQQLQVDEPKTVTTSGSDVASSGHGAAHDGDTVAMPAKPSSTHEVPEYLRQSTWSQQIFPAAIVALLVVVCLGLLISDPGFRKGIGDAKRELSKSGTVGGAAKSEADAPDPGEQSVVASTPVAAVQPSVEGTGTGTTAPRIDPIPPANATGKPAEINTPPATDAPADAVAVIRPADTAINKVDPTPVLNPALVQYTSNEGVVLRLNETQHQWFLLPRSSVVPPGEQLVVLEPFEAILDFDRGGIIATVMGDSAIRLMPPDRTTSTGLDIRRGRMLLRSGRRDAGQKALMSIRVGNELWRLELLTADTQCSIEVIPREPMQFEKSLEPNWYAGVLRVISGSAKWTSPDGQSHQVGSGYALEIAQQAVNASAVSSVYTPDWVDPQKRKQAPLRRYATNFEKQFELDQPVEMTFLALIRDPNAKVTELAVRGMALTEGDAAMVQALAECNFEEGRFAARDGLRMWLGRTAGRGPVLKNLLAQHYPPADANIVYLLLWGFRPEDASNRAASLELVSWLRNSQTEIRELAYHWIVQLTGGRKWEFRAVDPVGGRSESAVRRIEAHVMKTGAFAKPTENGAVPPKP